MIEFTANPNFDNLEICNTDTGGLPVLTDDSMTGLPLEFHNDITKGMNLEMQKQQYIDDIRQELHKLLHLKNGWDGPDSYGPRKEVIKDALEFVQHWTEFDEKLEPELEYDGVLSLQIYDQDRYLRGGISFTGNHEAGFSIVNRLQTIDSGEFCAESISQILNAIKKMNSALSTF